MFCPYCRTYNSRGAVVCRSCGNTLNVHSPSASRLAQASVALGILGLLLLGLTGRWLADRGANARSLAIVGLSLGAIAALLGLVLGIVGISQIRLSRGSLQGKGFAILGLVVSAVIFAMNLSAVPAALELREEARKRDCMFNLHLIGLELQMYLDDHDQRWPMKQNWCDALRLQPLPLVTSAFQCPWPWDEQGGYAYNPRLHAASAKSILSPATTVAIFDARGGWNASGGVELGSLRHNGGLNVLFADSRAKWMKALNSLK